ncbi:predicted protein, partial [Nematostella vectensis]
MLKANVDNYSVRSNALSPAVRARYIKLVPRGWHSRICMRLEFYGCRADPCDTPLGVQDHRIRKSMFSTTSMANHYYGPWSSKLQDRNHGHYRGGWVPRINNNKQWLQINLGARSRVNRIAIQGRYDANQWTETFKLSYSKDGSKFAFYKVGKYERIFQGNNDRYRVNVLRLIPPVVAQYVRIHPQTWYGHVALRTEIYGC